VGFLNSNDFVTADHYCGTFERLRRAIGRNRPRLLREGDIMLHDNARPHISIRICDWSRLYIWKFMNDNPDLMPSDLQVHPFKLTTYMEQTPL
jgi:hypothetical protein